MATHKLLEFSRLQLAQLGREYMLCAQFNSRTGYAALRINHGDESYKDVAIANWMGASPIYTRRMQQDWPETGPVLAAMHWLFAVEARLWHANQAVCKASLPYPDTVGFGQVATRNV